MKAVPRVSVVMPTFNYGRFLDEAILSVLNQTYTDFELIIVDNHSLDNTDAVVNKYLSDPRVHYHKNEKNIGLVNNWNLCLSYANGEYIKFLNADDKFHPQILNKFVSVLDEHPDVTLVTCNKETFDHSSETYKLPFSQLQDGKKVILHTLSTYDWIGEPTSVMFRKADLNGEKFNPKFALHVDWLLWLRLLSVGNCYIIPETLAFVRVHASQHTKKVTKTNFINSYEVYQLCKYMRPTLTGYELEINKLIKQQAVFCTKEAFYALPKSFKKERRHEFFEASKVGIAEGVVINAFAEVLKRIKYRLFK
jgi:glycosyltransferase involved in cell wall biosynthesis